MVKMNDIGDSNGEQAYWLDGKLSRNPGRRDHQLPREGLPCRRHLDL